MKTPNERLRELMDAAARLYNEDIADVMIMKLGEDRAVRQAMFESQVKIVERMAREFGAVCSDQVKDFVRPIYDELPQNWGDHVVDGKLTISIPADMVELIAGLYEEGA